MANVELWLEVVGKAVLSLLLQPFLYISWLLLLIIQLYRIRSERTMFSVKLTSWKKPFLQSISTGLWIAILLSVLNLGFGISLTIETLYWLWGISIFLSLFGIRYFCMAYSAGLVIVLHYIASFVGNLPLEGYFLSIYNSLLGIQVVHLLIISAVLQVAEAAFIRWQGSKLSSPVYIEGKRGKIIGGYTLESYWSVPLFLFVPANGAESGVLSTSSLAWQPLLLDPSINNWLLISFPFMIGFTHLTKTKYIPSAMRKVSRQLFLFSLIVLIVAVTSLWVDVLAIVAALILLFGQELLVYWNRRHETQGSPVYVKDVKGIKVLSVIANSPAEQLEIKPGEVISKVNGVKVHNREQLFEAMLLNPAFCKMEVYNEAGEIKFVQRSRYANEHHQLGIVLAPDEGVDYFAKYKHPSLITLFRKRKASNKRYSMDGSDNQLTINSDL